MAVVLSDQAHAMRWPWTHPVPHQTPIQEAMLLTQALLDEHDRLVAANQHTLGELRETVDVATTRNAQREIHV